MRLASLAGIGLLSAACAPKTEAPSAAAPAALSAAELDAVKAVDAAFAAGMNAAGRRAQAAAAAERIVEGLAKVRSGEAISQPARAAMQETIDTDAENVELLGSDRAARFDVEVDRAAMRFQEELREVLT